MKPFSKMEAIGFKKPVVTRNGSKVLGITEVDANLIYPVVGLVEGEDVVSTWTSDGLYSRTVGYSSRDLVMASTKHEGWINIYTNESSQAHLSGYSSPEGRTHRATNVFKTEHEADKHAVSFPRIARVKITWEE